MKPVGNFKVCLNQGSESLPFDFLDQIGLLLIIDLFGATSDKPKHQRQAKSQISGSHRLHPWTTPFSENHCIQPEAGIRGNRDSVAGFPHSLSALAL